ncbi:MAG: LysR family transcriptional regulator [Actinobacteria bacterium]|nr:LysR family transcriptional regulator [Actinomycetota bacterium]
MDIDNRTLELLEAIAAEGTLTAASRTLHLSQPSLSQRLIGLERQLGVQLFERAGRRLEPTRAGRRMIHATHAVLAELRATQRDLDDIRDGRAGVVRFASQCSTNYQWLPPVIHAFSGAWPEVELRIQPVADDDVVGAVVDDRLDVALASKSDRRLEGLAHRPLFEDELVAVVAADHEWAGRDHLDARDFAGVNLIVFDAYDPTRTPHLPLPIPEGAEPARITATPSVSELVVELVVAQHGVGILPSWVAAPYVAAGRVATLRLSERGEPREWYAAWRRNAPAHVEAFVDGLAAHFAARPTLPVP